MKYPLVKCDDTKGRVAALSTGAITKGGKDYPQAYYHYEIWSKGDRLVKSSKYIPKRLLTQVQQMEQEKAPVREILEVLGIVE
jgi:hypothetical protein